MEKIIYKHGMDNIFDFYFMDDFTTIASLKDDGIDISNLQHQDEDDFYCLTEQRVYNESQLFEKFNIKKITQ
jgi:hypothetical protein